MHDRATVVAQAAMELLVATMHGELQPREFYEQLVQLLRDEFADERCQAAADREPPDA
jgi:rubrerythrin